MTVSKANTTSSATRVLMLSMVSYVYHYMYFDNDCYSLTVFACLACFQMMLKVHVVCLLSHSTCLTIVVPPIISFS